MDFSDSSWQDCPDTGRSIGYVAPISETMLDNIRNMYIIRQHILTKSGFRNNGLTYNVTALECHIYSGGSWL